MIAVFRFEIHCQAVDVDVRRVLISPADAIVPVVPACTVFVSVLYIPAGLFYLTSNK